MGVIITEEEKLRPNLNNHLYLILLKFLPHLAAFFYIFSTLLQFFGYNPIVFGYIVHTSLTYCIFLYISSCIFRFCYVHRLPLYYIILNEFITVLDYLIGIPISVETLLGLHIVLIGSLLIGYSSYYVTNNKRRAT